MDTIGGFKKQTIIIVCSVVLISLFVVGMSYSSLSNIGSVTNNTVITNFPLTATFKESNVIEGELEFLNDTQGMDTSGKIFSVLNEADNSVSYVITIKLLDGNLIDPSSIKVSLDGDEPKKLSEYSFYDKEYIIGSNVLRNKNDVSDVATHNIRIWSIDNQKTYTHLEISVKGNVANNVLVDKIIDLKDNDDKSLFVDSFGNIRYFGSDINNFVLFNDELWRIVGVFKVTNSNDREELRVKIVKNDSIGYSPFILSNNYSWNSNIGSILLDYENNKENKYLTSYLKEDNRKLINSAVYNFGSLKFDNSYTATDLYDNEISAYDTFGRAINLGLDVGLLTASDFYFASKDKTSSNYLIDGNDYWLLNNDAESTNSAYYVDGEGSIKKDSTINSHNIKPVIFLKSTVVSEEGNGSVESPYVIK